MTEFKYSNSAREMEVYGYDSVVKSHCRSCHGGCGVLVYVKDGKIKKIAGDPDCPINHGTLVRQGHCYYSVGVSSRSPHLSGEKDRTQGKRQMGADHMG